MDSGVNGNFHIQKSISISFHFIFECSNSTGHAVKSLSQTVLMQNKGFAEPCQISRTINELSIVVPVCS